MGYQAIRLGKISTGGGDCTKTTQLLGRTNSQSIASLSTKPAHQGKACLVLNTGDPQRKIIVDCGAYIVP